jgi:hypothetical protein
MTISSKAKNIKVVKRTQYEKGKIPNFVAFSLPGCFHPYIEISMKFGYDHDHRFNGAFFYPFP